MNPTIFTALMILAAIATLTLLILMVRRRRRCLCVGSVPLIAKDGFREKISNLLRRDAPDAQFWSELETTLIESDVGVDTTTKLIGAVKSSKTMQDIKLSLCEKILGVFPKNTVSIKSKPHVILVLGVNGVGKTTTIAKLAKLYKDQGKKVLLVAADTFRAAAVEQLKEWGVSLGLEVVAQGSGADAAAVAFDGVEKAKAKGFDIVIIDTAGRLHTKQNLMEELKKVARVIGKAFDGAPHERVLVIDATVGGNGLNQAREFNEAMNLTGIVVAKLDGTAKGGVILAVASELGVPITHIGVGEKMDDLKPFDATQFVGSILS